MKFCIVKSKKVTPDLSNPNDGGSVYFIKLVKHLMRDQHEVTVLARNEKDHSEYYEVKKNNLKIVYLPFVKSTIKEVMENDYNEGWSFSSSVKKYLATNNNFDVIHTHHWTSAINFANQSIKWIHTPHLLAHAKKHYVGYACSQKIIESERQILNNCDQIIAVSCAEKKEMLIHYNIESPKVTVIPNGIDESFRKNTLGKKILKKNTLHLVTVARITKQKRLDTIVKAIRLLKDGGLFVKLKIIGEKYSDIFYFDYITDLITSLDLKSNIELVGFVTQDKLSFIYQQSDLYVQSSFYESQGIAIIEAMSCGLPIISTHQEALDEYFVEGENGFFYNGSDPKQLSQKIQFILSNSTLYNSISQNNIQKSCRFKWEKTYKKTFEIFDPNNNTKRNQILLNKAFKIGKRLISEQVVDNLAISGSVAKKNTWSGSDIDFVAIKINGKITEDFLLKDNIIENIHYISEGHVKKSLAMKDIPTLARHFHKKNIGEYLWGSIPVEKNNDLLNRTVKYISKVRHTTEYISALQSIYLNKFHTQLRVAKKLLKNDYEYLAAMSIRKATLYLSMKFMIGKGWVVQGSKKRPEQLVKFCESSIEKKFYNLFIEINSLSNSNLVDSLRKIQIRHQLRMKYYNLLVTVQDKYPSNEFIKKEIEHNSSTPNYYLKSLRYGYELGALYHVRNLSSFPDFLSRYFFIKTGKRIKNIDVLLQIKDIDNLIQTEWLEIMDLNKEKTGQWCSELMNYVEILIN